MAERHLFGTDGIRGKANDGNMTADIAMKVAMAAGTYFRNHAQSDRRPKVLIGKDTRLSGYLLEPALTAGFIAVGMDVVLLGPLPTPAIAMLTHTLRADLGVMISASHNPYHDNGIKLFNSKGQKLSDDAELEIEAMISNGMESLRAKPEDLGRALRLEDAAGRYMEFAKAVLPKSLRLNGLKIVVDCANGAAYKVAPSVLWELGAEVISIGDTPNGFNINENVGATCPQTISKAVQEHEADIGLALDGDADRLIVADETGNIVDGDHILGLIALDCKAQNKLPKPEIVGTVMSNLGLELYLQQQGITLHRAKVGDRYVVEMMEEKGLNLGGEQSGHMILQDYTTTGDGLITALEVLSVVKQSGQKTSEVLNVFTPTPQILHNVRFNGKDPSQNDNVKSVIKNAEKTLGAEGRLVIRKSGTEPVIRVMAQGTNQELLEQVVNDITMTIEKAC